MIQKLQKMIDQNLLPRRKVVLCAAYVAIQVIDGKHANWIKSKFYIWVVCFYRLFSHKLFIFCYVGRRLRDATSFIERRQRVTCVTPEELALLFNRFPICMWLWCVIPEYVWDCFVEGFWDNLLKFDYRSFVWDEIIYVCETILFKTSIMTICWSLFIIYLCETKYIFHTVSLLLCLFVWDNILLRQYIFSTVFESKLFPLLDQSRPTRTAPIKPGGERAQRDGPSTGHNDAAAVGTKFLSELRTGRRRGYFFSLLFFF